MSDDVTVRVAQPHQPCEPCSPYTRSRADDTSLVMAQPNHLLYSIFSIIQSQCKVKTLGTRFLGPSHYISTEKVQCSRFCWTKHLLKLSIFCCHGTQLTHLVHLKSLDEGNSNMSSSPTGCCALQWALWKRGGLTSRDRLNRSENYLLLGFLLVMPS